MRCSWLLIREARSGKDYVMTLTIIYSIFNQNAHSCKTKAFRLNDSQFVFLEYLYFRRMFCKLCNLLVNYNIIYVLKLFHTQIS